MSETFPRESPDKIEKKYAFTVLWGRIDSSVIHELERVLRKHNCKYNYHSTLQTSAELKDTLMTHISKQLGEATDDYNKDMQKVIERYMRDLFKQVIKEIDTWVKTEIG